MAANRDEAIKCIGISQRHLNAGNFPSARKFAEKSIALYPTSEAQQLLEIITARETGSSPSTPTSNENATASGAEAHPTQDSTHQRHAPQASTSKAANGSAHSPQKKRDYTPEMAAIVKRVRKCKVTEYYEILGLTKSCEENDVKRAYKKVPLSHTAWVEYLISYNQLALQLHPDKNGAPGADEAFKSMPSAIA